MTWSQNLLRVKPTSCELSHPTWAVCTIESSQKHNDCMETSTKIKRPRWRTLFCLIGIKRSYATIISHCNYIALPLLKMRCSEKTNEQHTARHVSDNTAHPWISCPVHKSLGFIVSLTKIKPSKAQMEVQSDILPFVMMALVCAGTLNCQQTNPHISINIQSTQASK